MILPDRRQSIVRFPAFRRYVLALAVCAGVLFPSAYCAAQSDSLGVNNYDFGYEYVYTHNVGYVTVRNLGTQPIQIYGASVPPADTSIFNVQFNIDSLTLQPGRFTPIAVYVTLPDTLTHTAIFTVRSNATADSVVQITVSATGTNMNIYTSAQNVEAYPYQYISIPVIAQKVDDPLGLTFVQSYHCRIQYDATLLELDTTALINKSDSIGVSSGYTFTIDSLSRPGNLLFNAKGTTGGIHATGDTIFKLNFYVNQILENNSTPILATFAADSGYPYVHFYSSPGTFAELPCASPASVYPATAAHLISAYPNPFNPQAVVRFSVDRTGYVSIRLYNTSGMLVQTLVNGIVSAGVHSVMFDASALPSGKYICRLATPLSSEIILATL
ncbi:MAG TPA: hypothetical protein VFA55_04480, partial [Candidatus Kapabacteria bacterium]|nr:hypothetical protein [Candidatus Kapabacteria bacterium]